MKEEIAQIIFIALNLVSIALVGTVIYDLVSVLYAITSKTHRIPFDGALYYLLLSSVFWLMYLIQYYGKKDKQSFWYLKASHIIIGWFVFTLILANAIPAYLKNRLLNSGYSQCLEPQSIQRTTKSENLIFILGRCEHTVNNTSK